jgi:hypothetical protein
VLLWADRAAFLIGTVATVVNEHRGEIIERYGESGRQFLRYVDIVRSATAIYGFARVTISMAQLVNGFRSSYQNWRATVRAVEGQLDDGERAVAQQVSQQADEVLQDADNINAARTQPDAPAEQLPAPKPETATEKPATPGAASAEPDRFADLDALAESGKRQVKGGRTHAGREYQKHMDRGEVPKVPGKQFDSAGQELLDDIVKSPTTRQYPLEGGSFKGGKIFVREDGLGAAFDKDGVFRYFGRFRYDG